jgi:hypothetical protein
LTRIPIKSQIPSTNFQTNSKFQLSKRCDTFWNLNFEIYLEIVIWDLEFKPNFGNRRHLNSLCFLLISLRRGFFGLGGGRGGQVEDLTALVPSAGHAEGMALAERPAIGAFRHPRRCERMMRTPIVAVSPRRAHSVYHVEQYYTGLRFVQ